MRVYRITLEKYSYQLFASGKPGRWNSKGTFVIYSASSRALACLENIVHRSGEGLHSEFRTMVISFPESLKQIEIKVKTLPSNWKLFGSQYLTREIGDNWSRSFESAILKVPSAIIPEEHNFLFNPNHPDFKKIKLESTDIFELDNRLIVDSDA